MNKEKCSETASKLLGAVDILAGKNDTVDVQAAFAQSAALFAIAESLHAVADALKPGEKT